MSERERSVVTLGWENAHGTSRGVAVRVLGKLLRYHWLRFRSPDWLQFVVITLGAEINAPGSDSAVGAFGTPKIIHFCAVLLIAAILSAPWSALASADIALGVAAVAGLGYALLVVRRARRQTAYVPVPEQEKVIGRTKGDSTELADEIRGPQSHVARNVIVEHGEEQHIFRRNTPFGNPAVHGTMFVGFSADQHRLARRLSRMADAEDGIRDALTYYRSAVSGAYYFVPSVQALRSLRRTRSRSR